MSDKRVTPIRISDNNERGEPIPPMVLTIFGKRYRIESDIRIIEAPARKLARVVPISWGGAGAGELA